MRKYEIPWQARTADRSFDAIIFLMIVIRIKRVKKKGKVEKRGSNCMEKWWNFANAQEGGIVKPYAVCNSIQWRNNVRCTKDLCYEAAFSSFFQIFLEFYSFQLCAEPEKRTHDSSDTIFMHYFFHVIFFVRHPYYRVVFNQPLQRNRILLKYDIIMYIIMRVRILLRIQKIYS